jgi:hypothetical protein
LHQAELDRHGRLPEAIRRRLEPWPLEGIADDHPHARRWQQEWALLGFVPGPPLLGLVRAAAPAGLDDSRSLSGATGRKVRLAALVVVPEHRKQPGQSLLGDEWGLLSVQAASGTELPRRGAVLVEGTVEMVFDAPLLRASGVVPLSGRPVQATGQAGAVPAA